jgi:tRNA dimethylallyltransferase
MSISKSLIVIAGPTGVGKTALAVKVAVALSTEIVSADSRQIYREMEIGTAKPSVEELKTVKHHFINSQSIHDPYDAGQFGRDALQLIHELFKIHDRIILCGGSGLYISAVCEGFDDMPDVPEGVREKIMTDYREKGLRWLQEEVRAADPEYFESVDRKNPQRLVRALELYVATGLPMMSLRKKKKLNHDFGIIRVGVELERASLYERIDSRVDKMMQAGLEAEARALYPLRHLNALQTVGYQELFGYFEGQYDLAEAVNLLKRNSRRYAKRQLTWFKRDQEMSWYAPDQGEAILALALR